MSQTLIDMSQIPAPACVVPVSFQSELDYLLDDYTLGMREENEDPTFPVPLVSDPAYQILSTVAKRIGLRRQEINEACHATMLAYAMGADLDQIGLNHGVLRLLVTAEDLNANPPVAAVFESDTRFRKRIQLKQESISTAGASGAYEYHILTSDVTIIGVFVDRPEFDRVVDTANPNRFTLETTYDARLPEPMPGDVSLTVLIPTDADDVLLETAETAVNARNIRPVTDTPVIDAAEIIEYTVDAVIYVYPGPSSDPIIAAAKTELEVYTAEMYQLGHDIASSGLHAAAHQKGTQRVELTLTNISTGETSANNDITIENWQAGHCTALNVSLGGRDV